MKNFKDKSIKIIGNIVRYCACAVTIEKINISESLILNYYVISPIITFILWKLSYYTCKKVVYQKLDIYESIAGSIGYTVIYFVYLMSLSGILIVLKHIGVIPFANDFDERLINFIIQYFNNLIIDYSNKIVEILQITSK